MKLRGRRRSGGTSDPTRAAPEKRRHGEAGESQGDKSATVADHGNASAPSPALATTNGIAPFVGIPDEVAVA